MGKLEEKIEQEPRGICFLKGTGCDHEDVCDGHGQYIEKGKPVSCGRGVYSEVELWTGQ